MVHFLMLKKMIPFPQLLWTGCELQRWVGSVLFDGLHNSSLPWWVSLANSWCVVGCLPSTSG